MLAQYRIISEVFLFLLGLLLAFQLTSSFSRNELQFETRAKSSMFELTAHKISGFLLKTISHDNSTLCFKVPVKIGNDCYLLGLENEISINDIRGGELASASIFGLDNEFNTSGRACSSALYLCLRKSGDEIYLVRG